MKFESKLRALGQSHQLPTADLEQEASKPFGQPHQFRDFGKLLFWPILFMSYHVYRFS
jgi:hypothetical protein